jgi:hypothetical protein
MLALAAIRKAAPPLHLVPPQTAAEEQHILAVTFRSAAGRRWRAIGGGQTIAAAIEWARESCPDGVPWRAESWTALYGD